jgi:chromosome partitioning protein
MLVIPMVTQKGGSGKSTICLSLAVAAQEAGRSVCILELDKQATAAQWATARKKEPPQVETIPENTKIETVLARLRASGHFDVVLIDTPGVDSPNNKAIIASSDFCLIPCRPSPADLRGMRPTLDAIQRLGKAFAFVLSQAPAKSFRVRDSAEGLHMLGLLADTVIVMRNDHQDAIGSGQGVTELNPTGQAADEIRRLWQWIDNETRRGQANVQAA